ncbi:scavenger receptor cysteine-rich type 1 protein M130-like isoform X2 [Morone saxatilis]|uniref:scavenger receptor cysteine-rich type 1 protein M130-like isoform X2 n=1 Tax=Morone saxatilis TaxID=34816 RepID=UPI0015E233DC|nr:scavenger receptor cysteine-rich type 1 protein M130-like isoform X2 [Morone saxatilis]
MFCTVRVSTSSRDNRSCFPLSVNNMKLLKCILIIQLSCLCQAFQNSSSQTDPTDAPVSAEEEEFNSDPYIHKLSGECSFTLRMAGNRSSEVVALTADSAHMLVEEICQALDCGSVYHVNKTNSPANTTCFQSCLYQNGSLQNCSQSMGSNCTVIGAVCGHQTVRLAGGSDRCAGRVELWKDGRWGTVCDDQWDLEEAHVVCAQLGCGYALNVTGQGGSFPPGRGPIHLDDLNCTGKEENLWACPAARDEPDCGHKEDAGVICSEMKAVRLTGGLDRCSGKVEIHRDGSWGTLCDNCWNKDMASMVCSMLQCGAEPLKYTQFLPPLLHNEGALWYYLCNSNMQNMWECMEYKNIEHLCASSKASGVICNGSLGFPAPTTATTANATVITSWTTAAPVVVEGFSLPSIELLSTITLSLLLLVVLITNTVLCCHYKRRHAFLLQQTRTSSRPSSENHHNNYHESVNLIKVTTNPPETDDSQRYKTEMNPLMKPSGLESLFEEGTEPRDEVMGAFTGYNGDCTDPQYARVSKITVDSFDTSSTSSGECYENTNPKGYVVVTPEPGTSQSSVANDTFDPLRMYTNDYSKTTTNLYNSGDEDGPIYSPVSPDQIPSSEDDYDDVGPL